MLVIDPIVAAEYADGLDRHRDRPAPPSEPRTVRDDKHDLARVELLKEIAPRINRAAFLFNPDFKAAASFGC
jgi:hypothetical protein